MRRRWSCSFAKPERKHLSSVAGDRSGHRSRARFLLRLGRRARCCSACWSPGAQPTASAQDHCREAVPDNGTPTPVWAPPPGYDGQFDEPNGGLLGRSVRFTARDIFLEEGWSAPPRGWRSGPNCSRASRRDRPVEGKACGGQQEFCPRRGGTWSSAFGTASAWLKRLEVVKQHNAARRGGLRERIGGGRTRHDADALFVFLGGCRHGRLRVQLRRSPCQSTRRE